MATLVSLLPVLAVVAIAMILISIPMWLIGQFLMWKSGLTKEEIDRL